MRVVRFLEKRGESGQIIVIVPILMLLLVGAFVMMVNTGNLGRDIIQTQISSDTAARGAAYTQALTYCAVIELNAVILAETARLDSDAADPFMWWRVPSDYRAIRRTRGQQDDLVSDCRGVATAVAVWYGYQNGKKVAALIGFEKPNFNREWWTYTYAWYSGLMVPGGRVEAYSEVETTSLKKPAMTGGNWLGRFVDIPLVAKSIAKPYYTGYPGINARDPRNDDLKWYERFGLAQGILPPTIWDAKLVSKDNK